MNESASLQTARLLLRPFVLADAPDVQRLAGERDVADTTFNIPHPYLDGMAEQWIVTHRELFGRGELANFAIVLRTTDTLVGAIGLRINALDRNAELGYWIGRPFWNMGYGTEAARAVVAYGLGPLGLRRIHARHLARNPSSGRVMQKVGMRPEGCLRQHVMKWGVLEDLVLYGILQDEYAGEFPAGTADPMQVPHGP
jgi:RimJ/RimL family protein N-acetyltransferase